MNTPETSRGCLFLVTGPSGAGKDSLLAALREGLAGDPAFTFPRRVITRPAVAGGEDHRAVPVEVFDRMRGQGMFMLAWDAHGLRYGVGSEAAGALASGRHVIVNVSRAVIDEARRTLQPVCVLHVTASDTALRERLTARGREAGAAVEARLARARAFEVSGDDVVPVCNDGALAASVSAALAAIRSRVRGPRS